MTNMRAAGLMVLSMALFAVEDMFLKLLAQNLPVGQVLAMAGALGMVIFWGIMAARGKRFWTRDLLHPLVITRNLSEGIAGMAFLTALSTGDLSSASAILQALPLAMTLGAAVYLKEHVGWRRWLSIGVGFVGVMLIVRPGTDAFQPATLLAVLAVLVLVVRDLVTRRIPAEIESDGLTASAFGAMMLAGLCLTLFTREPLVAAVPVDLLRLLGSASMGVAAYAAMVASMRLAPIAAIAPFRYSRLVFAMFLGMIVFGERPDAMTWLGSAIITASGIYAMWRESRLIRQGPQARPATSAGTAGSPDVVPRRVR